MAIQRMLVPIDESIIAGRALDFAIERAKMYGAELTVAFAVNRLSVEVAMASPYVFVDPTPMLEALDAEANAVLDAGESRVKQAGVASKRVKLDGIAAPAILRYIREANVDAIVMGTHGRRGFERVAVGSVAEDVIRSSHVPVFVVPMRDEGALKNGALTNVLVAIDGSPASRYGLTFACEFACIEGARLSLCTVIEPTSPGVDLGANAIAVEVEDQARRLLEESRAQASLAGIEADGLLLRGAATAEILSAARSTHADLILVGTHGRAGLPRFLLGSVAEGVLRSSSIPVCTVHRN